MASGEYADSFSSSSKGNTPANASANVALSDGTCVFLSLVASLAALSLVVAARAVLRYLSSDRKFDVASDASRRITDSFEIDDEASMGGGVDGVDEDGEVSSIRSGGRRKRRREKTTKKKRTALSTAKDYNGAVAGLYAPPADNDNDAEVDEGVESIGKDALGGADLQRRSSPMGEGALV